MEIISKIDACSIVIEKNFDLLVEALGKDSVRGMVKSLSQSMDIMEENGEHPFIASYHELVCEIVGYTVNMLLSGVNIKSTEEQVSYLINNPSVKADLVRVLEAHLHSCTETSVHDTDFKAYKEQLSHLVTIFAQIDGADVSGSVSRFKSLGGYNWPMTA